MPRKLKVKIKENEKTVKNVLHRPMILDEIEGKKLKKCCVVEDIEHQWEKIENDGITDDK